MTVIRSLTAPHPNVLHGSDLDSGNLGVEKESTSWQVLEVTEIRSLTAPHPMHFMVLTRTVVT